MSSSENGLAYFVPFLNWRLASLVSDFFKKYSAHVSLLLRLPLLFMQLVELGVFHIGMKRRSDGHEYAVCAL